MEDSEPSVMGGSNRSTDSRTTVKCSAHSSVHPGIKFTKVSYWRICNLIFFSKLQVSNHRCEKKRKELTGRLVQFLKLLVKSRSNLNIQEGVGAIVWHYQAFVTVWRFKFVQFKNCHYLYLPRPIFLQPFNSDFFFLSISVTLARPSERMQVHSVQLCIHLFIYILINSNLSAVYIWREATQCKRITLLITATILRSWIDFQQPIIWGLTEYMVLLCLVWIIYTFTFRPWQPNLKLHLLWNLNRVRHEALFFGIVLLHNILRFCVPVSCAGHLGSVDKIMMILSKTVIISLPVALGKFFESVTSGIYRQLKFWNRRHDTDNTAWGSFWLYLCAITCLSEMNLSSKYLLSQYFIYILYGYLSTALIVMFYCLFELPYCFFVLFLFCVSVFPLTF